MCDNDGEIESLLAQVMRLEHQLEEEKQRQIVLRMQLQDYRFLFDATPVMFWYKDTRNNVVRVNKAAADFEQTPIAELEGKSCFDLYPIDQAEAYFLDDQEVITSGRPKLNIVERHSCPSSGQMMWVQTGKVPYRDMEGRIIGVVAFAVDVTEQKLMEEILRNGWNFRAN